MSPGGMPPSGAVCAMTGDWASPKLPDKIRWRTPMPATESDEHLLWRYRLGTGVKHATIGWRNSRILAVTVQ